MIDLSRHGGACRCLLRLHENGGNPVISDRAFVERYLRRFPDWEERPGDVDLGRLLTIAQDLRLATRLDALREYDHVLREHRAGKAILVLTERAPQQDTQDTRCRRYTLVLLGMDESGFSVWCPFPSGQEETFKRVDRRCWDEWLSIAMILESSPVPAAGSGVPASDDPEGSEIPAAEDVPAVTHA